MISHVINEMKEINIGDSKRINHVLKVYDFGIKIAKDEDLTQEELLILKIALILHDIGIKESEKKYNSSDATYQQIEGPPIAYEILSKCKYNKATIERVCYLIANHHRYDNINGIDYQILVESDFLVNIEEEKINENEIKIIKNKVFKTNTGKALLKHLYKV